MERSTIRCMAGAAGLYALTMADVTNFVAPAGRLPGAQLRGAPAPQLVSATAERAPLMGAAVGGLRMVAAGFAASAACMSLQRRSKTQRRAEPEVDPRRKEEKPQVPPVRMPVIDTGSGTIDVMSKLLQDRILILGGQVNDEMANVLIAQMLYLAGEDKEKDITIYINSPGGSVSAGLAIYDTMQFVPCDVQTVCFGSAASMGAFLLGAGTKGKRKALPNSRVMIHQPLGGAGGQAADIEIQAKEILFLRDVLNTYLSDFTSQPIEKIAEDCDRDYFMTPEEAKEYGIIDEVITTKSWPRLQKPPKPSL